MAASTLTFRRRHEHRVLLGVAGGFADRHGIDPLVVRGALVVLTFAGGLGIVLYAIGTLLSAFDGTDEAAPGEIHPIDPVRHASVAAITAGAALVMRSTGLWLGDQVMVPLAVVVSGVVLLGVLRPAALDRTAVTGPLAGVVAGHHARARVIAGAGLVALGLVIVGLGGGVSGGLRVGVLATAITILGIGVMLGPWFARAAQAAAEERRQRIRSNEREAMAAHLHDSVLQTLALIQRNAEDPRRTVTLARQQERELRSWLYGGSQQSAATLDGAVRAVADEVETAYDVQVDVVLVGDVPIDDRVEAFVAALREACINAAKHSGESRFAVYVEVATDGPTGGVVDGFVRDRGCGFQPGAAMPDRRGIAQSIEARMARVGGTATIEAAPGAGTEVHLSLPGLVTEVRP